MRRFYTVMLFIVMASLDNTVLALLPVIAPRVRNALDVSNQAIGHHRHARLGRASGNDRDEHVIHCIIRINDRSGDWPRMYLDRGI
jgi:hypothetical protein